MKKLAIVTSCFIALLACNNEQTAAPAETVAPPASYDWLLGNWQRTNDTEGRLTFENWTKLNDSTYLSHGFTLKGADTVWQEYVRLSPQNNTWLFSVKMNPADSTTTDFTVTEQGETFFNCENPQNDFPKLIKYKKSDDKLLAEISADTMKVNYVFEKRAQ